MRASALVVGLSCASIAFSTLCGCSWKKLLPAEAPTLPNAVAVDRALRLCSLSEGNQPFHLILEISPPAEGASAAESLPASATSPRSASSGPLASESRPAQMRATIEIFWLDAITYRTEIRSARFRQSRIVNGNVVEENNTGDYYPRWIQDFVEGILNPLPEAARFRRIPGDIPIGLRSQACITASGSSNDSAQLCFNNVEPRIAGVTTSRRSLWYDDYFPFGSQQISRAIVDRLQPNLLVHGQVAVLEPLDRKFYRSLKATRFTPAVQQLDTATVSARAAQKLLAVPYSVNAHALPQIPAASTQPTKADTASGETPSTGPQTPIYIRTDRTGRVREAYRSPADQFGLEDAALSRAFTLRFKPLNVNGAPRQMETLLYMPATPSSGPGILYRTP